MFSPRRKFPEDSLFSSTYLHRRYYNVMACQVLNEKSSLGYLQYFNRAPRMMMGNVPAKTALVREAETRIFRLEDPNFQVIELTSFGAVNRELTTSEYPKFTDTIHSRSHNHRSRDRTRLSVKSFRVSVAMSRPQDDRNQEATIYLVSTDVELSLHD